MPECVESIRSRKISITSDITPTPSLNGFTVADFFAAQKKTKNRLNRGDSHDEKGNGLGGNVLWHFVVAAESGGGKLHQFTDLAK